MNRRIVGNTNLEVSEIALGTGDNAGCIIYGTPRQQLEMVSRALELGVTTFDCSPDYGKGLGEANLGRVLRELGVESPEIITKVEILPEEFGRMGDKVRESVRDSLLRLGRSSVDVVMVHNPIRAARDKNVRLWTPLTADDVIDEILPALDALREAGLVRHFGLACEAAETQAVRPVLKTRQFALVNAWFNLANPSAEFSVSGLPPNEQYDGLFDAVREAGAGIAVIRPLAGGALTKSIQSRSHEGRHELSRGLLRDRPDIFEPEIDRARRFAFLSSDAQSISEAAYRFILSVSGVSTVIGGFSEPAHLEDAVRASQAGPLSGDDMREIEAIYTNGF